MHIQRSDQAQQGFVSILVSMIIMLILTLILLGYARVMTQEQKQALDRQLSTQAFYAAESGVNDASKLVDKNPNLAEITECGGVNPLSTNYNRDLDASANVRYTCVLVNPTPSDLQYQVPENQSTIVVPIINKSGNPINEITIAWQNSQEDTTPSFVSGSMAASHAFPQKGDTNAPMPTGVIRLSLMPVNSGGTIPDRNTLIARQATYFLYPKNSSVSVVNVPEVTYAGSPNDGLIVDANCNVGNKPFYCVTKIKGLGGLNTDTLYLRVKSIYQASILSITAQDSGGVDVKFAKAQAVIDATGKASDVLRRIVVRKSLKQDFSVPEYAVESFDTLCKRLQVWPGTAAGVGGATIDATGFSPSDTTSYNNINSPANPCSIR